MNQLFTSDGNSVIHYSLFNFFKKEKESVIQNVRHSIGQPFGFHLVSSESQWYMGKHSEGAGVSVLV